MTQTESTPAELVIVSLVPELLNTNGDAANARVLAQRARWAGHESRIVEVHAGEGLPEHADAVVIGSGTDADLIAARDALAAFVDRLRVWCTSGVPILAVGTGWELISWGIELSGGAVIEGLGLVAGRAVPGSGRATDDLIVTSKHGRLIGFENHARNYVGAEASPLGRVVYGSGNGGGQEGLTMGSLYCTHLHGPVLARNPALADHLLSIAFTRRGAEYVRSERSGQVDDIAKAARNQIAMRLGFASE